MGNTRIKVFGVSVSFLASCPAAGVAHLEQVTSVPSLRVKPGAPYSEKAGEGKLNTSFCLREWAQVVPLLEQTAGEKRRSADQGKCRAGCCLQGLPYPIGMREASAEGHVLPLAVGKLAAARLQGPTDLSWIWKLWLGENLSVMGQVLRWC